jgi:hypothetical protein
VYNPGFPQEQTKVNSKKWLNERFTCHMHYLLFGLGMPPNFPNARELKIQIAKWQRLLGPYPVPALKRSTVAARREEGRRSARAIEQGKKVRNLARESLKRNMKRNAEITGQPTTKKEITEQYSKTQRWMRQSVEFFKKNNSMEFIQVMLSARPKGYLPRGSSKN